MIVGFLVRPAAVGLIIVMVVAIAKGPDRDAGRETPRIAALRQSAVRTRGTAR